MPQAAATRRAPALGTTFQPSAESWEVAIGLALPVIHNSPPWLADAISVRGALQFR